MRWTVVFAMFLTAATVNAQVRSARPTSRGPEVFRGVPRGFAPSSAVRPGFRSFSRQNVLVTPQLPFSSYYPYYPYYPEPYYSQPAYSTLDESANNAQINSLTAEIQRLTAEVQQLQDELAAARTPPVQPSSLQVVPSTTPAPVIPVVLVYRDGHQVEIQGYAIMGQILWTTRQDGFKKIPLSDLNLDSTREENLKRGVNFMPER